MKKVRAAIVGYGNIGHFVLEALQAAPDLKSPEWCVVQEQRTVLQN